VSATAIPLLMYAICSGLDKDVLGGMHLDACENGGGVVNVKVERIASVSEISENDVLP